MLIPEMKRASKLFDDVAEGRNSKAVRDSESHRPTQVDKETARRLAEVYGEFADGLDALADEIETANETRVPVSWGGGSGGWLGRHPLDPLANLTVRAIQSAAA